MIFKIQKLFNSHYSNIDFYFLGRIIFIYFLKNEEQIDPKFSCKF